MAVTNDNIANFLDIVDLIPQLYDAEESSFNVLSEIELRSLITRTDSRLRMELKPYYSGTLTTSTPYATPPVPRFGNTQTGNLLLQNPAGSSTLTVSSSLTATQVYTITFTSATAFSVSSDLTGANGTGSTSSNFTTTDTFLTIPSALWNGSFFNGDVHYVKVYTHESALVQLSALLAANQVLNTIYTEEVPDASASAEKYMEQYLRQMRALQRGEAFLEKGLSTRDINPIQLDYEIDEYGTDATNYADKDYNPRTGY